MALFADPDFVAGMASAIPAMFAQGVEGYVDGNRRADGPGWASFDVSAITCPVIVVHGGSDTISAVVQAHHTAEIVPNTALRISPELGHFSITFEPSAARRARPASLSRRREPWRHVPGGLENARHRVRVVHQHLAFEAVGQEEQREVGTEVGERSSRRAPLPSPAADLLERLEVLCPQADVVNAPTSRTSAPDVRPRLPSISNTLSTVPSPMSMEQRRSPSSPPVASVSLTTSP